ncbi:hypothetical protein MKX03_011879 [Papaver bracteatum]|nr:hypothetical protein MKX03_011879 [Papaver bracteatum]
MKLISFLRTTRIPSSLLEKIGLPQCRFIHKYVPRDPKDKPKIYRYPIMQLAERMTALPPEELAQIGPTLRNKIQHPKMQLIDSECTDLGSQGGASVGSAKVEEKKVEKTAFDVKLEKFDAASKIKVIKEVREFTSLGLKEAKSNCMEKAPVIMKQGVTKEEADGIIEKLKAIGGVAVME